MFVLVEQAGGAEGAPQPGEACANDQDLFHGVLLDAAIIDVVAAAVGKGYALWVGLDCGPTGVQQMLKACPVCP
ncbi:hypothetical protein PRtIB026_A37100 [Pseudomonas sp. RtIB026]|nr:hypothetical protein PRtIB026_A37100 [Pseudomonas sp. RtIB026]